MTTHGAVEAGVAEGEEPAVRGDQPVAAPVGRRGDAHDGRGEAVTPHRAVEAGGPEGEHTPVRGDEPVTLAVRRRRDAHGGSGEGDGHRCAGQERLHLAPREVEGRGSRGVDEELGPARVALVGGGIEACAHQTGLAAQRHQDVVAVSPAPRGVPGGAVDVVGAQAVVVHPEVDGLEGAAHRTGPVASPRRPRESRRRRGVGVLGGGGRRRLVQRRRHRREGRQAARRALQVGGGEQLLLGGELGPVGGEHHAGEAFLVPGVGDGGQRGVLAPGVLSKELPVQLLRKFGDGAMLAGGSPGAAARARSGVGLGGRLRCDRDRRARAPAARPVPARAPGRERARQRHRQCQHDQEADPGPPRHEACGRQAPATCVSPRVSRHPVGIGTLRAVINSRRGKIGHTFRIVPGPGRLPTLCGLTTKRPQRGPRPRRTRGRLGLLSVMTRRCIERNRALSRTRSDSPSTRRHGDVTATVSGV